MIISLFALISITNNSITYNEHGHFFAIIDNIIDSLSYINLSFVVLSVIIFMLLRDFRASKHKASNIIISSFASMILFFYLYLGQIIRTQGSLQNATSNLLWFKVLIKTFCSGIIGSLVWLKIESIVKQYIEEHKFQTTNQSFQFIKRFCIMFFCWAPYYVILFPGTGNPDTHNQLLEFFGMGKIARSIYPTGYYLLGQHPFSISNQHDFVMTILVGTCVKLGLVLFGKANFGFAIASFLQMLLCAFSFCYSISLLNSFPKSQNVAKAVFWLFCLLPIFPIYSLYLVKNTVYSASLLLLIALLMQFSLNRQVIHAFQWKVEFCLVIIIQIISEKFAIDVLLVLLICLFISYRSFAKQWFLLLLCPILIVHFGLTGVFKALNVPPSDPIEAYSVPIQQTAFWLKEHPKELSRTEYQQLNKVFVVKNLSNLYNPIWADPVKSAGGVSTNDRMGYRFKTVTKKDINQYKKLWIQMGLKHPKTYALAFLNLNYGYFDINSRQTDTTVTQSSNSLPLTLVEQEIPSISGHAYKLKQNNFFLPIRKIMAHLFNMLVGVPCFSLFLNGVIYIWVIVFLLLLCIYISGWKYVVSFVPAIMQIPILLLSPANNSQRYIYPMIFSAFLFLLFVDIVTHGDTHNN